MEREKNNTELICFNGLFNESEQGLYSLYDFIYSCRESYNSTYPDPQSQSFRNSLIMMKKLKNEIGSNNIFSSHESFTFRKLMKEESVFIKYLLLGKPLIEEIRYYRSILPGIKKGISGFFIDGNNMGIIKNISEDKKEAALEVLKYFTSKEYQIKIFNEKCIPAISELWYDEELCKNELCDIAKSDQFTMEPEFIKDKPDYYRKKYQKYIYQYLYGNDITVDEASKHIEDLTKVYYVSLDTKNSYVGLICFVFFSVISAFMLLSLIFIFVDNFNPFFMFLSEEFWIITVLGSIMVFWIPLWRV